MAKNAELEPERPLPQEEAADALVELRVRVRVNRCVLDEDSDRNLWTIVKCWIPIEAQADESTAGEQLLGLPQAIQDACAWVLAKKDVKSVSLREQSVTRLELYDRRKDVTPSYELEDKGGAVYALFGVAVKARLDKAQQRKVSLAFELRLPGSSAQKWAPDHEAQWVYARLR